MLSVSENETPISLETVLAAVADEQRRIVLRSLNRADSKTTEIGALTEHVAARVQNGSTSDDGHRNRVQMALHHTHLPKLDACGMIVYDTETKQIRDTTGEIEQKLLQVIEPFEKVK